MYANTASVSEYKSKREKQVIIPNRERWYYIALKKKFSAVLRGITNNDVFYCLKCLRSFTEKYAKVKILAAL